MCTVGLGVAGLVRASTQLARAYGTGRGGQDADEPGDRPEVVIDTGEPLDDLPRGVVASRLDKAAGGERAYPYRYEGFRLLLASGGRLFLVTPGRRPGRDRTIVLPCKDVRVRLVAQSQGTAKRRPPRRPAPLGARGTAHPTTTPPHPQDTRTPARGAGNGATDHNAAAPARPRY